MRYTHRARARERETDARARAHTQERKEGERERARDREREREREREPMAFCSTYLAEGCANRSRPEPLPTIGSCGRCCLIVGRFFFLGVESGSGWAWGSGSYRVKVTRGDRVRVRDRDTVRGRGKDSGRNGESGTESSYWLRLWGRGLLHRNRNL